MATIQGSAWGQLSPARIAALQEQGEKEGWTFSVSENPATAYSLDELCGLVVPDDWQKDAHFDPCTPRRDLPSSYNWCSVAGCPSVKNQGGCGSCWAFSAVGALECNILIQDATEVNLSEQWLVSCNREGWGCDGGWWAHDYHEWKGDDCGGYGAVFEEHFPYVAYDAACNCPYPHQYLIDGWSYIGDPWTTPSVEAIKQAILDYGPVSVAIAVNDTFQAYGGGVFTACSASTINHAVVLVGWDDNQGSDGIWYLRNSWGPGWGEGGYMRLGYGCNMVGFNATYIVYVGDSSVKTCELNVLEASDPTWGAEYGQAVAANEEAAMVGAHKLPCPAGDQCGAAYALRRSQDSWDEEQKLTASDADSGDGFGTSVSIGEDVALVGAPGDDDGGETDAGSAYVFRYSVGTWTEEQKLTAPVAGQGVEFGKSVVVEGDVAVIGAPGEGGSGGDGPGAAFVFRYGGSTWNLEQTLTASDGTDGDGFGTSISLSGTTVIVGAPFVACGAGSSCGAAYAFRYDGGTWSQEQKLTASDGLSLDWFGFSVSMDGSQAMVGAPLSDSEAGDNSGAVYAFERFGSTWLEQGKIITRDRATSNYVGWSVAILDGVGMTGAFGLDCTDGSNCGAAYFIRKIDGDWEVDGKLVASDMGDGDSYGSSVALGKHVALVGAKTRYYPALASAGGVYAYAFPKDCNENRIADVCDIVTGYSTDTDGNGRPDECLCFESSPALPEVLDLPSAPVSRKIRYVSFQAGDAGMAQAVRMTFQDVPPPYDHWTGTRLWVQKPQEYCENAGVAQQSPCPDSVGGLSEKSFFGATLGCDPHWDNWSQYGTIHVWDEGIVPGGLYDLQVIDESCSTVAESDYSSVLTQSQSAWADLIRDCTTSPCGSPDGSTGIVDVTAILDKWKNLPGNVQKVRADIEGSPAGDHRIPDQAINITDVTYCLGAFLGETYPGPGFPAPGNPPTCGP